MKILRWLRSQALLIVALTSFGWVVALNGNQIGLNLGASIRHTLAAPIQLAKEPPVGSWRTPAQPSVSPPFPSPPLESPRQPPTLPSRSPSVAPPKLGHFPYPQADVQTLVEIGKYGRRVETLAPEAAIAWQQMVKAAAANNVSLVPISGFRSVNEQAMLFRDRVQQRGLERAAKSVAPPGYSEHHTGYAIDIGDGRAPRTDITSAFAQTAASRWLTTHAQDFNFELSFQSNNAQQIIYEPWHWRFIGSPHALHVFASARRNRS
ncbi:M15 family metallopeptidase [Myxacorys almedinensis]|uniref:D-alanyl-D-alanine carboxypeptidase family protein n=1 Tax=Myxacorys almedinensis A TaxID=2690445 RepID=A0A8J8CL33_9CYAN|nr:M15 family metallopeptidase [Myxacorys almedinensis]NDJ17300.1 D-alanyl-D-alanine carboxypeptidase family protein [Myxacorys almedinensis A]